MLPGQEPSQESRESNGKNIFWKFEVFTIENSDIKFPWPIFLQAIFNGKKFEFSKTIFTTRFLRLRRIFLARCKNFRKFWNFTGLWWNIYFPIKFCFGSLFSKLGLWAISERCTVERNCCWPKGPCADDPPRHGRSASSEVCGKFADQVARRTPHQNVECSLKRHFIGNPSLLNFHEISGK